MNFNRNKILIISGHLDVRPDLGCYKGVERRLAAAYIYDLQ